MKSLDKLDKFSLLLLPINNSQTISYLTIQINSCSSFPFSLWNGTLHTNDSYALVEKELSWSAGCPLQWCDVQEACHLWVTSQRGSEKCEESKYLENEKWMYHFFYRKRQFSTKHLEILCIYYTCSKIYFHIFCDDTCLLFLEVCWTWCF